MAPIHRGLYDLTSKQVDGLASLLYVAPRDIHTNGRPRSSWYAKQEEKMSRSSFAKRLRRPRGALNWLRLRIAERTGWENEDLLPKIADLCEVHHRGLNPWLIHNIFKLVHDEVTFHADRVRTYRGELLRAGTGVQDFVDRTTGISSLWLTPAKFDELFARRSDSPPVPADCRFKPLFNAVGPIDGADGPRPRRRHSCEACVLAVVSGRPALLSALRASLLSRTGKGRSSPILLRLVDAWIDFYNGSIPDDVMSESLALSLVLRDVREAEKERRRRKREERDRAAIARKAAERPLEQHQKPASSSRQGGGGSSRSRSSKILKPESSCSRSRSLKAEAKPKPSSSRSHSQRDESSSALSAKNLAELEARTKAEQQARRASQEPRPASSVLTAEASHSMSSRFSALGFDDDQYTEIGMRADQDRRRGGNSQPRDTRTTHRGSFVPGPGKDGDGSTTKPSHPPSLSEKLAQRRETMDREHEDADARRERIIMNWYKRMSQAGRGLVNEDGVSFMQDDDVDEFPGYREMLMEDAVSSEDEADDDEADDDDQVDQGGSETRASMAPEPLSHSSLFPPNIYSGGGGGGDDGASWVSASVHSNSSSATLPGVPATLGQGWSAQPRPGERGASVVVGTPPQSRPPPVPRRHEEWDDDNMTVSSFHSERSLVMRNRQRQRVVRKKERKEAEEEKAKNGGGGGGDAKPSSSRSHHNHDKPVPSSSQQPSSSGNSLRSSSSLRSSAHSDATATAATSRSSGTGTSTRATSSSGLKDGGDKPELRNPFGSTRAAHRPPPPFEVSPSDVASRGYRAGDEDKTKRDSVASRDRHGRRDRRD